MFRTDECEAELKAICECSPIRAASVGQKILDVLWKEQLTPKHPAMAMSALAAKVYLLPEHLREAGENNLRAAISRLQNALALCYRVHLDRADGEICLELYRNPVQHGYAIRFVPFPGPYSSRVAGAADRFWAALHAKILSASRSHNSCRVNIFFANQEGRHLLRTGGAAAKRGAQSGVDLLHTGTGEAVGAFLLGQTFARLGIEAQVYPSSTIPEDARHHDQISVFLGSSYGIKLLEETRADPWLRRKQRFVFSWERTDKYSQNIHIDDTLKSERFECNKTGTHSYIEHALISYFYNDSRNQALVAFEGIDTLGTEQAVRELTSNSVLLPYLEQRYGLFPNAPFEFEALLEIEIVRNAPAECRCIGTSTPHELSRSKDKAASPAFHGDWPRLR